MNALCLISEEIYAPSHHRCVMLPYLNIPIQNGFNFYNILINRLEDLGEADKIPKLCFLTRNANEVTIDNARTIIEKAEDNAKAMEELGFK